jgi:chloride channel 3/4/5
MEPHEQVSVEACAGDIMTSPVHTLHATQETVMSVLERLQQTTCSGFPIVTNSLDSSSAARLIVGYTSRSDVTALLERGLEHDKLSAASHVIFTPGAAANDALDLSACVDTTPIVLAESTPFAKLSRVFMSMGLRYCLVTRLGQLVGIVTRKSLYAFVRERASHASPDEPDSAD